MKLTLAWVLRRVKLKLMEICVHCAIRVHVSDVADGVSVSSQAQLNGCALGASFMDVPL